MVGYLVVRDSPYEGPERRSREAQADQLEPVVLTRKLADAIDGIDLGGREVGDRLAVTPHQASLLIAEGWAVPTPAGQRRRLSEESPSGRTVERIADRAHERNR